MDEDAQRDRLALAGIGLAVAISTLLLLLLLTMVNPFASASPPAPPPVPAESPAPEDVGPQWVRLPSGEEVLDDGTVVVSSAMLIELAEQACGVDLDYGDCDGVEVRVVDFMDPQVGEAGIWVEPGEGARMGSDYIALDPDLIGMSTLMVQHVIAHEWNHIEQTALAGTVERYEQMEARADAYFAPRAREGVNIGGLELLTDCMTTYQDFRPGVPVGEYLTGYVSEYLTSTTMREACGQGWESLLPHPL